MSKWIEIKDKENVEIDGDQLIILSEIDYNGNCYVAVNLAWIKDLLKEDIKRFRKEIDSY